MAHHVEASQRRARRLRIALGLNALIVVGQVAVGLASHSLGLLADAGHNLTDVLAVALSLVAVRLTTRRPTASRSFGYHRSTVLAAQANAGAILVVTAAIAVEAVRRLLHPSAVHAGPVAIAAGVALVVNLAAARSVHEHGDDLNMRSAAVHLLGDAAASFGVVVVAVTMLAAGGLWWLDPAVSLAIGLVIAFEAARLLRDATDVLLESTPVGLDMDEVARTMTGVAGVEGVHDLHAWSLSSDVRALSAHVVMEGHPTLEEAQVVADAVKRAVAAPFSIAHATLELECEACFEPCAIDEPGDPAAEASNSLAT